MKHDCAITKVPCSFEKREILRRVHGRLAVALDMNAWINMAEDKSITASKVKLELQRLVAKGVVFCPLSAGLIWELYKQTGNSLLKVGRLMEELSLNVTYSICVEVFRWEAEYAIHKLSGAHFPQNSSSAIYAPVVAYLSSYFNLSFADEFPKDRIDQYVQDYIAKVSSLTLTELINMRIAGKGDDAFDHIKQLKTPKYSECAKRVFCAVKGDKNKMLRLEAELAFKNYIEPVIPTIPPSVRIDFMEYMLTAKKDSYGGFLHEILENMPALYNHVELMAGALQLPQRKDKSSHFFDNEIIPIPLAYATVLVAQDKGIRDLLQHRTNIQKRSNCKYLFDLEQLGVWLKGMEQLNDPC